MTKLRQAWRDRDTTLVADGLLAVAMLAGFGLSLAFNPPLPGLQTTPGLLIVAERESE